jgi:hypothetical protein
MDAFPIHNSCKIQNRRIGTDRRRRFEEKYAGPERRLAGERRKWVRLFAKLESKLQCSRA